MRKYLSSFIALLLLPILALMAACNAANIADLTSVLGNAASSIAALEGNTVLASQLKSDTAVAVLEIQEFKAGNTAQDVISALNIVLADLQLFPVTSQYAPLIGLAVATIDSIIAIVDPTALSANAVRSHAYTVPKSSKEFKAQWNQIAVTSGHPEAKIKADFPAPVCEPGYPCKLHGK
jgi:hypothetical protein